MKPKKISCTAEQTHKRLSNGGWSVTEQATWAWKHKVIKEEPEFASSAWRSGASAVIRITHCSFSPNILQWRHCVEGWSVNTTIIRWDFGCENVWRIFTMIVTQRFGRFHNANNKLTWEDCETQQEQVPDQVNHDTESYQSSFNARPPVKHTHTFTCSPHRGRWESGDNTQTKQAADWNQINAQGRVWHSASVPRQANIHVCAVTLCIHRDYILRKTNPAKPGKSSRKTRCLLYTELSH